MRSEQIMNSAAHLRLQSIGDLFDAAFRLYRRQFWPMVTICALGYAPSVAAQFWLQQNIGAGGLLWYYLRAFGATMIWYMLVGSIMVGTLIVLGSDAYLGRPSSLGRALRTSLSRYHALVPALIIPFLLSYASSLLISVLLNPLILVGYFSPLGRGGGVGGSALLALLCLTPLVLGVGVILLLPYAYLILTPQAIVLEGRGPIAGLARSGRLIGHTRWRALLLVILTRMLLYLFTTIPWLLLTFVALRLDARLSSSILPILSFMLTFVGQIFATPIQITVFTLLYYDRRIRAEGYDIELRSEQTALA
jgi:hypothetical protein